MNEIDAIRHVREQTETQFESVMSDLIAAIGKVERLGPLTDEQIYRLQRAGDRLRIAVDQLVPIGALLK